MWSEACSTEVCLNVKQGAFADGKVNLLSYCEVVTVKQSAAVWPYDNRFVTRPDTWATCTHPHEVVIENKDAIVLDAKNNTFTGPEGYFKVVIDEFDGTTVKAWHMEDKEGNKTPDLSNRRSGKNVNLDRKRGVMWKRECV